MSSTRIFIEELEAFCVEAMRYYGIREADAQLTAHILVMTDTWGVHTHGTRQLRPLLRNFPIGRLDANATAEVVNEGAAWALVDGHHSLPFVTAQRAMDIAIEKAKTCGIGFVSVFHTSHFGAAGNYAVQAAQAGMIGLAMCNADPTMTVPGARGKVLGTNPIAYAIPGGTRPSVFMDIATSAVAANKVIRAKLLGEAIPSGWLVDDAGLPTTDPRGFPEQGALMPMAAHKGYGFALLVEVLAGVMSGAALTSNQPSWIPNMLNDSPGFADQGQMFIAIDAGATLPQDTFNERMTWLVDYLHDVPKASDHSRVYLPGEIEWEKRANALAYGMILPPDVIDSLNGLAEDTGMMALPFKRADT